MVKSSQVSEPSDGLTRQATAETSCPPVVDVGAAEKALEAEQSLASSFADPTALPSHENIATEYGQNVPSGMNQYVALKSAEACPDPGFDDDAAVERRDSSLGGGSARTTDV